MNQEEKRLLQYYSLMASCKDKKTKFKQCESNKPQDRAFWCVLFENDYRKCITELHENKKYQH